MKTFYVAVFLAIVNFSYGQNLTWRFAVGDRSATIYPFTNVFDKKIYPVIQAGIEYKYFERSGFSLSQTAMLHYNYHPYLGQDFGIFSELAASRSFKKPYFIQFDLGLGYLAELPIDKTFKLNREGDYVATRHLLSMVTVPLTLLVGYKLKNSISPFLAYQYSLEFPYNRTIPILPTDNLLIGIKVPFIKRSKDEKH